MKQKKVFLFENPYMDILMHLKQLSVVAVSKFAAGNGNVSVSVSQYVPFEFWHDQALKRFSNTNNNKYHRFEYQEYTQSNFVTFVDLNTHEKTCHQVTPPVYFTMNSIDADASHVSHVLKIQEKSKTDIPLHKIYVAQTYQHITEHHVYSFEVDSGDSVDSMNPKYSIEMHVIINIKDVTKPLSHMISLICDIQYCEEIEYSDELETIFKNTFYAPPISNIGNQYYFKKD